MKSCHSGLVHDKKYAYILTICLVNDLKYHCIGTSSSLALTYNSSSVWFCLLSGCTDFSDLCRINMYDPKPNKGKRLLQASIVGKLVIHIAWFTSNGPFGQTMCKSSEILCYLIFSFSKGSNLKKIIQSPVA